VINKEIVEFQTALPLDSENEANRITSIREKYDRIASSWKGNIPLKISDMVSEGDEETLPTTYSTQIVQAVQENLPDSIPNTRDSLVLGTSKTGALQYGMNLLEGHKLGICADDLVGLDECYRNIFKSITSFDRRRLVLINDESSSFVNLSKEFSSCMYISGVSALDGFIDDIKPELNARLTEKEAREEQLFIVISEYNKFFSMITDEQAAFMRKVMQYIDSPQYGIYFICGFDVNGDKSNDRLFMSLLVNTDNHLICPFSFEKASSKIESLPVITDPKPTNCYFCVDDKNVAIRW
ncbi:MAG: hypothetical protein IKN12_07135, partial [Selenomonadaceae bacterium]|nr:hypothetical protein [Selenomonadaceae bacterium]